MDNSPTDFAAFLKGLLGDEICKTPIVFSPNENGTNDTALGVVYEGKKLRVLIQDVEQDES